MAGHCIHALLPAHRLHRLNRFAISPPQWRHRTPAGTREGSPMFFLGLVVLADSPAGSSRHHPSLAARLVEHVADLPVVGSWPSGRCGHALLQGQSTNQGNIECTSPVAEVRARFRPRSEATSVATRSHRSFPPGELSTPAVCSTSGMAPSSCPPGPSASPRSGCQGAGTKSAGFQRRPVKIKDPARWGHGLQAQSLSDQGEQPAGIRESPARFTSHWVSRTLKARRCQRELGLAANA